MPKKILITGICGFVGNRIAKHWIQTTPNIEIIGVDNLLRSGSEINRQELKSLGIRFFHGDIRSRVDCEALPPVDFVIDCAANPSVLAGVDGTTSSRQVMEHNLMGTVELLEYCRSHRAGFILLSTSRVYSIATLAQLPMRQSGLRFELNDEEVLPDGVSAMGIGEKCSTHPPLSLYGASKYAAEMLALEYGEAFDFPVWINRCGVMAGPGQFGRTDQGIISFWIHAHRSRKPLKYIGFGGKGQQVRDFFDPRDLVSLLSAQVESPARECPRIINLGGGVERSTSLAELTAWCEDRFGKHQVAASDEPRPFDLPWVVLDSTLAANHWGWTPQTTGQEILESTAEHAMKHPRWLDMAL